MQNGSHVFLNGAFVLALALELDCLFTACLFGHLGGRVILAPIFLLFQHSCTIIFYILMALTKLFIHCCLWNGDSLNW